MPINKRVTEEQVEKITYFVMLGLLALAVIPMLIVALYARPMADDFGFSVATHDVWQSTHSVFKLLAAALSCVKSVYLTWQGSFSAELLFALEPAVFSEKIYGVSTFILIFFFLLGNFLFWKAVIPEMSRMRGIVFSALSIVLLQTLPHAFQGFYWWNGASYYTLFYSLSLILWALVLREKKLILACVLGFIIGGGNLVTALLNVEILAIYIVFKAINKRTGIYKEVFVFICSFLGLIINAVAPGNAVRAADSISRPAFEAIAQSFLDAYSYMNEWFSLPVIILIVFIAPFLLRNGKNMDSPFKDVPYYLLVIIMFCLFASSFTPTEYATSEVGPRRIQNIRYYLYVTFIVILEYEAINRIVKLVDFKDGWWNRFFIANLFTVIALTFLLLSVNTIPKENRQNLTSIAAVRSLVIGESRDYAKEMDIRTGLLNSVDAEVTLPSLYNHPELIYNMEFDITGNPEDYRDQSVCDFYHKDRIILENN